MAGNFTFLQCTYAEALPDTVLYLPVAHKIQSPPTPSILSLFSGVCALLLYLPAGQLAHSKTGEAKRETVQVRVRIMALV